jgi:hypothetical protein
MAGLFTKWQYLTVSTEARILIRVEERGVCTALVGYPPSKERCSKVEFSLLWTRVHNKEKSKAEVGVQIIERWILVRLRHHNFFTLADLNQCIRSLLDDLNSRPFRRLSGNRPKAFEKLDQPALRALPKHPDEYLEIRRCKNNNSGHPVVSRTGLGTSDPTR